jgi:hypothetical protein
MRRPLKRLARRAVCSAADAEGSSLGSVIGARGSFANEVSFSEPFGALLTESTPASRESIAGCKCSEGPGWTDEGAESIEDMRIG